jgi:hypothetical protein
MRYLVELNAPFVAYLLQHILDRLSHYITPSVHHHTHTHYYQYTYILPFISRIHPSMSEDEGRGRKGNDEPMPFCFEQSFSSSLSV